MLLFCGTRDESALQRVSVGVPRADFCEFELQFASFVRATTSQFDNSCADQFHRGSSRVSLKEEGFGAVDRASNRYQRPDRAAKRGIQFGIEIGADFALDRDAATREA